MKRTLTWAAGITAAASAALAAYMLYEAQWLDAREVDLDLPGLPAALSGLSVLHLSDVHAGQAGLNLRTLEKAVRWAAPRHPDLVVLTGDVLGGKTKHDRRALQLLARLDPPLGIFAVTGNHEYGISKNPLSRIRDVAGQWEQAGVGLLRDRCELLEVSPLGRLVLCGADYLTGGYRFSGPLPEEGGFALLLTHRPPEQEDPRYSRFGLILAGHTHGGQLRIPARSGLRPLHDQGEAVVEGICRWGDSTIVVSRGIGTTFVPFRLLSRPEVRLLRLRPGALRINYGDKE